MALCHQSDDVCRIEGCPSFRKHRSPLGQNECTFHRYTHATKEIKSKWPSLTDEQILAPMPSFALFMHAGKNLNVDESPHHGPKNMD
jgi:hypothetical protein